MFVGWLIHLSLFPKLPTIIADNAGYDSADLVAKLRAAHTEGKKSYGLGTNISVDYQKLFCTFYCVR